mmetsp:Transcript_87778/g.179322  ORF Transcript_87778/g.179322 Transcript_87778/m.179322 type:complete len:347 (+) Transcript_87778:51-1091(+)
MLWWLVVLALSPIGTAENCEHREQCEEDAQALIQRQSEQRSAAGLGVSVGAHISTLDGQRYPFAKCGTYEMWGLRGVPAKALGGVELDPNTKRPVNVNWQLLAHYSGKHKIKIRALLLQDLSNPTDSLMQITAEDCRWERKLVSPTKESRGEPKWSSWLLDPTVGPLSSGVTSVKLSNVSFQLKKKANGFDHWFSELHLFLHTQDGNHVEVADMKIHCMQGDQVGARVNMHRREDIKWVVGQIAAGKHSADAHFIPDQWAALGGSNQASFFLHRSDLKLGGLKLFQVCDENDRSEASKICAKQLQVSEEDPAFQACVDDACRGASEVEATSADAEDVADSDGMIDD